jgi:ubiquinone/menaquinone biosynthesis C-methylase UbiE
MFNQVNKLHYWTEEYLCKDRFLHLREQFLTILRINPSSILEIGPGPGLLTGILKHIFDHVVTLDYAEDICPNIVSDVTDMPFEDSLFDMVCAFQMLEHVPWDRIYIALREMSRVSKKYVLFSVPDNNYMKRTIFSFQVKMFEHSVGTIFSKRAFQGISNPKEHLWEIGVRPVTSDLVLDVIQRVNLTCNSNWVDGANHYFLCSK